MVRHLDTGKYNKNQKRYHNLVTEIYQNYPQGVTLPAEYAHYLKSDLTTFLVRMARYKFVTRMVKAKDRVLDVGCGSGIGSIYLGQYCQKVTGIEVKSTEIDAARVMNRRENVTFTKIDLYDLPKDKIFDVIVAMDVIEHFSVKDGNRLIAEMVKHLMPNGLVVIGTPSIYSYPYQSKLSQASHVKCYDQQELVGLVDQYLRRTIVFSMNDEIVHTGNPKMAWYYIVLGWGRKNG
jgi:2-polyprenyl-3-methyl-5-hydroxy-6-metoxy-1,4-benzoquinol methylase